MTVSASHPGLGQRQHSCEIVRSPTGPFDVPNAELGHHGEYCSFDVIIACYGLDKDFALAELAKIIRGADTPKQDWAAEGIGHEAIADGFSDASARMTSTTRSASSPCTTRSTRTARRSSRIDLRGADRRPRFYSPYGLKPSRTPFRSLDAGIKIKILADKWQKKRN
jgi:hypothetical protein